MVFSVGSPQSVSALVGATRGMGNAQALGFGRNGVNPQEEAKKELERVKQDQYSKIYAHESAHKSAGGSLAGGININYDGNGIAVSGHVPIKMPALDPENPEQTAADARTVHAAACAPGCDCSAQDLRVAAQAQSILGQAQVLMSQKKERQQMMAQLDGGGGVAQNRAVPTKALSLIG